jgi:hypothetical protein
MYALTEQPYTALTFHENACALMHVGVPSTPTPVCDTLQAISVY